MKKIFCAVFLLFLLFNAAFSAEPENFIPAQAQGIIRADVSGLFAKPWAKKILLDANNNPDFAAGMAKIKGILGMEPQEVIFGNVYIAVSDPDVQSNGIILANTRMTEANFAALFNAAAADKSCKFTRAIVNNKTIYTVTPLKKGQEQLQDAISMLYLAGDVILLGKAAAVNETLLQMLGNGNQAANPLLKQINRTALVAVIIDVASLSGSSDQCQLLTGTLDTRGNTLESLQLELLMQGIFKDKAASKQLAMQLQLMFPGLVGMIFGKDENLAMELAMALKVKPKKELLNVKYSISYATLKKIEKYLADPANRAGFGSAQSVGPAAAPPANK